MKNTSFVNPNGLPIYSLKEPSKPPKENISTPRDISILAKYMFDNYEKEVTSITDKQVYSYPERGFCLFVHNFYEVIYTSTYVFCYCYCSIIT